MASPLIVNLDDSDADGLHWELTPQQSDGFGRAIGAALDRDLAVGVVAVAVVTGRAEPGTSLSKRSE